MADLLPTVLRLKSSSIHHNGGFGDTHMDFCKPHLDQWDSQRNYCDKSPACAFTLRSQWLENQHPTPGNHMRANPPHYIGISIIETGKTIWILGAQNKGLFHVWIQRCPKRVIIAASIHTHIAWVIPAPPTSYSNGRFSKMDLEVTTGAIYTVLQYYIRLQKAPSASVIHNDTLMHISSGG